MSHTIKLRDKIYFGKCVGKTPIDIIKSKSKVDIRYLLWLREQKKGKWPLCVFDDDCHHSLDALIRSNSLIYGDYAIRYSETQYDVWRAEKRLQIEREKEEKAKRIEAEIKAVKDRIDLQKLKIEEERNKFLERECKRKMKAEMLVIANQKRAETYGVTWGAWS